MYYIAEARSFNEGIEFYIKDMVIIARRQNGEVVISKDNKSNIKVNRSRYQPFILLLISIINAFIIQYCTMLRGSKAEILVLLVLLWIFTVCYYFVNSRNLKNIQSFKYHAAEHKVLNYWDKYNKMPSNCDEVMKMSSISIRCGSTILVVILTLITLASIGILFIPWIILKIVWGIASIFITLYLWANGKCDFLQKLVLRPPTYSEIEVAFLGMQERLKIEQEIS